MTNRVVVFSGRCIPNIFKYCDHSLTFQKSGDQDSLRHKLKSSADTYESSVLQFFRTTTGTQWKPEISE